MLNKESNLWLMKISAMLVSMLAVVFVSGSGAFLLNGISIYLLALVACLIGVTWNKIGSYCINSKLSGLSTCIISLIAGVVLWVAYIMLSSIAVVGTFDVLIGFAVLLMKQNGFALIALGLLISLGLIQGTQSAVDSLDGNGKRNVLVNICLYFPAMFLTCCLMELWDSGLKGFSDLNGFFELFLPLIGSFWIPFIIVWVITKRFGSKVRADIDRQLRKW